MIRIAQYVLVLVVLLLMAVTAWGIWNCPFWLAKAFGVYLLFAECVFLVSVWEELTS